MKIYTIIGTRPEIIRLCDWEKEIIFTGQHFDYQMGQRFITDLPKDKYIHYLDCNIDHSKIRVIVGKLIEKINEIGKPDCIIVHGDTRSAIAGALTAKKLKILLAHTEAGVRCYDNTIEEIYRRKIDRISNYNFCPIPIAVNNLRKEGITQGVYFTGDILYDTFIKNRGCWDLVFVTIHRRENIENKDKLKLLIDSLAEYGHVIFPVHPHTRECLDKYNISLPRNVIVKEPLTYKETLQFIRDARLVLTDSGGIQREAFWSGTPCLLARRKTEWGYYTSSFGNGKAGEMIKALLDKKAPYRRIKDGF